MGNLEGLWTDLNPVQQFLYYGDTWSNFFWSDLDSKYICISDTRIEPSGASFTQISGGVLARW